MGVVFLVVVPTEKYEKVLKSGKNCFSFLKFSGSTWKESFFFNEPLDTYITGLLNANVIAAAKNYNLPAVPKPDLSIRPPVADENAILRMEIELRDKHQPAKKRNKVKQFAAMDLNVGNSPNVVLDVCMEKVRVNCLSLTRFDILLLHSRHCRQQILDDLLKKLEIEHVVWYNDKPGNYCQVIFPVASGDPCETTLHCLVELGIGKKFNSSVRWIIMQIESWRIKYSKADSQLNFHFYANNSILPASVSYDATNDNSNEEDYG